MATATDRKSALVKDYQRHDKDSGSTEVQIALLTERITDLSEHVKTHAKDNHSRRGLLQMVSRRNRLLHYLSDTEHQKYVGLIGRLGLRK
jgi:small subunit ribosomal protein S15